MAGELIRRPAGAVMPARTRRAINNVGSEATISRAVIRAKTVVAEQAMHELAYLTALQTQLETQNPASSEAVALIMATTIQGVARSVASFAMGLD